MNIEHVNYTPNIYITDDNKPVKVYLDDCKPDTFEMSTKTEKQQKNKVSWLKEYFKDCFGLRPEKNETAKNNSELTLKNIDNKNRSNPLNDAFKNKINHAVESNPDTEVIVEDKDGISNTLSIKDNGITFNKEDKSIYFKLSESKNGEKRLCVDYLNKNNNSSSDVTFDENGKLKAAKAVGLFEGESILQMLETAVELGKQEFQNQFDFRNIEQIVKNIK